MDKIKSLYIDCPIWYLGVKQDDFIVMIGVKKSNSVYHVLEVTKEVKNTEKRTKRCYLKVIDSDLPTALRRDSEQALIPMQWYKRKKNQK